MNISSWTLFVVYFLITNIFDIGFSQKILDAESRKRLEHLRCSKRFTTSHNKAIFSAYRRYRLNRLKIRYETLWKVKNSTVNSSILLPPHTLGRSSKSLSSYFPSLGQHQPLEILFTIL
jgi:hypothetical protein